ncbi:MAG: hypothetical protein HY042_04500, partial [Spirochaetia bacterium]|nr:hypothetical protein [Spirochaetia bacterium]
MKHALRVTLALLLGAAILTSCKRHENSDDDLLLAAGLILYSPWIQVTPTAQGSITVHGKAFTYSAQCSGDPMGTVPNSTFSYFV